MVSHYLLVLYMFGQGAFVPMPAEFQDFTHYKSLASCSRAADKFDKANLHNDIYSQCMAVTAKK